MQGLPVLFNIRCLARSPPLVFETRAGAGPELARNVGLVRWWPPSRARGATTCLVELALRGSRRQ